MASQTTAQITAPQVQDDHPPAESLLEEVLQGLSRPQKHLPTKYLYDEQGSALFEEICELDEYYPTRTELAIMQQHAGEMAAELGERVMLVELGSGASVKTRLLLDELVRPAAYVPVDISRDHLQATAEALAAAYPQIEVLPVCADFTQPIELPTSRQEVQRTVVYFPGSTIGNFHPEYALKLLKNIGDLCGDGGGLLIGIDLKKDTATLEAAYNDASGVTAAFNLNLLDRLNREIAADFDVDAFRHVAFYNDADGRIEMHLESLAEQEFMIDGEAFAIDRGETICTEYSYKHAVEDFAEMAADAGFSLSDVWTDADEMFGVLYLMHR